MAKNQLLKAILTCTFISLIVGLYSTCLVLSQNQENKGMGILVVFCLVETLGLKETVVSSCCLLHLTRQSCFLEDDSYPYDAGISLPAVSYRTDLQLHYILVLPKVVRKVITNFYLRYLVLIFFSNVDSQELWIVIHISWFFNICLKESCFPDCCKVYLIIWHIQ